MNEPKIITSYIGGILSMDLTKFSLFILEQMKSIPLEDLPSAVIVFTGNSAVDSLIELEIFYQES